MRESSNNVIKLERLGGGGEEEENFDRSHFTIDFNYRLVQRREKRETEDLQQCTHSIYARFSHPTDRIN